MDLRNNPVEYPYLLVMVQLIIFHFCLNFFYCKVSVELPLIVRGQTSFLGLWNIYRLHTYIHLCHYKDCVCAGFPRSDSLLFICYVIIFVMGLSKVLKKMSTRISRYSFIFTTTEQVLFFLLLILQNILKPVFFSLTSRICLWYCPWYFLVQFLF